MLHLLEWRRYERHQRRAERRRNRYHRDREGGGGAACGRGRVQERAGRFAAKEAVMKALGTGAKGVAWREIEVLPNHRGKPLVYLYGRARGRAGRAGVGGGWGLA